jgi:phosphoglycolate phosphatase
MISHVLFDFDGTLVDSADGILATLRKCIDAEALAYVVEPSRGLIGPPLRAMIERVVGPGAATIDRIEAAFRAEYDARGYLSTSPYPGIPTVLDRFRQAGVRMHIVTNKRRAPLLRILERLGWQRQFESLNTLDTTPGAASKSAVAARVLADHGLEPAAASMIGDSADDCNAARDNGMPFAWVNWGYGRDLPLGPRDVLLADAGELLNYVLASADRG